MSYKNAPLIPAKLPIDDIGLTSPTHFLYNGLAIGEYSRSVIYPCYLSELKALSFMFSFLHSGSCGKAWDQEIAGSCPGRFN